jgi:hypothetical protein
LKDLNISTEGASVEELLVAVLPLPAEVAVVLGLGETEGWGAEGVGSRLGRRVEDCEMVLLEGLSLPALEEDLAEVGGSWSRDMGGVCREDVMSEV